MNRLPRPNRDDSLIRQVVAANVLLVSLTLVAGILAAGVRHDETSQLLVLILLIVLTFCVNLWMLQRRFRPLERLIDRLEEFDPSEHEPLHLPGSRVGELDRLARSFNRLLDRVDEERRRSAQLVLRAQEAERGRVARDLHDEVNQALTALLLRLEALGQDVGDEHRDEVAELKLLTTTAMGELLNLARQLRPTALDDHGLVPAIEAQVRGFGERTGIEARLRTSGAPSELDAETQTVVYRIAQEALANAGRHAEASRVDVELDTEPGAALLRVVDDGRGFDPGHRRPGGLGLEGMTERARLVGGELDLRSAPGRGTAITLRMP